jgi:hypothetical protein
MSCLDDVSRRYRAGSMESRKKRAIGVCSEFVG